MASERRDVSTTMPHASIRPGEVWLDTDGNRIQAHGGSIIAVDGTFYWYGENKEKTLPGSGIWHWGVRCYASDDLYNWVDKGLIIPPDTDDPSSPLHPSQSMDRPHILFNARTRKFVCWLKIMENDHSQTATVLTADNVLGPYTMIRSGMRPLGMSAGDFDLVVDPTDGKAYHYFERVHSELICADLTDDYTDVTGSSSAHFPNGHPPHVREAPAHFSRNGLHYLFTSGTTGYLPNPSEVACAQTYHGPWTVLGNPHPDDRSRTSYNSQISSVFKHPAKHDLYIALADRWLADLPDKVGDTFWTGAASDAIARMFAAFFDPQRAHGAGAVDAVSDDQGPDRTELFTLISDPNTSVADYVWLPVRFDGQMAYLDWNDEWTIEEYE